jgi:5-methylcytosine-specific restriction endonuclease McrA
MPEAFRQKMREVASKRPNFGLKEEHKRLKTKTRRLKTRFLALARDNHTCQYCGRRPPEVKLEVDHRYPKSKGGLDNLDNYITACADCNLGKRDIILAEFTDNKALQSWGVQLSSG